MVTTIAPQHFVQVVIPNGAFEGQILDVALPSGGTMKVSVPAGAQPGQTLQVLSLIHI